jgi:hypothetical protein
MPGSVAEWGGFSTPVRSRHARVVPHPAEVPVVACCRASPFSHGDRRAGKELITIREGDSKIVVELAVRSGEPAIAGIRHVPSKNIEAEPIALEGAEPSGRSQGIVFQGQRHESRIRGGSCDGPDPFEVWREVTIDGLPRAYHQREKQSEKRQHKVSGNSWRCGVVPPQKRPRRDSGLRRGPGCFHEVPLLMRCGEMRESPAGDVRRHSARLAGERVKKTQNGDLRFEVAVWKSRPFGVHPLQWTFKVAFLSRGAGI